MKETIFNTINEILPNHTGIKVFWSIVVIVSLILASRGIKNLIYKKMMDTTKFYTIKQRINYITGILIVVFIVFIWMDAGNNLGTYIGLLSAGIAIALKEIFTNMAGWLFIEFRKPFEVGHRISIGDNKGDVIDKRVFQFSIIEVSSFEDGEQSTGRIVDIPNSFVFLHPTINYTKGFEYIWNEIRILLTFESDWHQAKDLFHEVAVKHSSSAIEEAEAQIKDAGKKYMIHYTKLTPIVYTDVKDSGIQLTVRYLCEPKQRRTTSNHIWEEVLTITETYENIDLAYPTKRVING